MAVGEPVDVPDPLASGAGAGSGLTEPGSGTALCRFKDGLGRHGDFTRIR